MTVENFIHAKTETAFGLPVKEGALGKFHHRRAPMAIDDQIVARQS